MEHVGVRELRASLAALVRQAGAGHGVVVTVDGIPVAQLGPLDGAGSDPSLDELVERGEIIGPATPVAEDPRFVTELRTGARIDRLLREVRGR